jgi:hypothetical protein
MPPASLSQSARPQRIRRLPARYQDLYPEPPCPIASSSTSADSLFPLESAIIPPESTVVPRVTLIVRNRFETAPNSFGLWKEYLYRPSYDPDASVSPEDLYRHHTSASVPDKEGLEEASIYSNKSVELLLDWQNSGSAGKSNEEINRLVRDVLLHPDFKLGELQNFNATRENQNADKADEKSPFLRSFQHSDIHIDVPSGSKDIPPRTFAISGLHHRKITALIKESFESHLFLKFHLSPYKLFRRHPDSGVDERIHSEMYDSDVFLDEHDKVQRAPTDDSMCKREKVIAALMFWSDATHVATFGTAKMWPVYMLFGNLSKYVRCQPNSGATKHLAYIPPLPDALQDQLKSFHQKWDTQQKDVLTHCRRELMHSVWSLLLDNDFVHAYNYGMIVRCQDGIERRIYPRIFTYSADYPEK